MLNTNTIYYLNADIESQAQILTYFFSLNLLKIRNVIPLKMELFAPNIDLLTLKINLF